MARRTRPPDEILTRKDLVELQQRLSMMSVTAVQDFYRSAYFVCRNRAGAFSEREGYPRTGPGMETNEQMAMRRDTGLVP
jgi:hypothetical protein